MKITTNPIALRLATASEKKMASNIDAAWEGTVLASEIAFPGKISLYYGVEYGDVIESGGWIGTV